MSGQSPLPPGGGGERASKARHTPIADETLDRARGMRQKDTRAEKHAWVLLRAHRMFGLKFKRQVPIDQYIVDFYCHELKLIVEIDGTVHGEEDAIERDIARTTRLQELGYQVIRIPNSELLSSDAALIERIRPLTPSPYPLPEGEGCKPPT
jgi:very-short-patch-repair endonuclease